jgi:hypothetical protein
MKRRQQPSGESTGAKMKEEQTQAVMKERSRMNEE